jgi:hypothetical protein
VNEQQERRRPVGGGAGGPADVPSLGDLQGTLSHVGEQVQELLAAVHRDAAIMRARAEEEARAIRHAAAAEAATEREALEARRRDFESEAAQRGEELQAERAAFEAEVAQRRQDLAAREQAVAAERARLERVLTEGTRAMAAVQSALLFDAGPLLGESAVAGTSMELGAPATLPQPAAPPAAPVAAAPEPEPPPEEPAAVEADAAMSGGMAEVDAQLARGDVEGALVTLRAVCQTPGQGEAAIARLSAMVADPAYEAQRDELLELLAEAYLARDEGESEGAGENDAAAGARRPRAGRGARSAG